MLLEITSCQENAAAIAFDSLPVFFNVMSMYASGSEEFSIWCGT